MDALLNTAQVAQRLRISPRGVRALIARGRLPAQKLGRDWLVRAGDLKRVAGRRRGRPRKK